MSCYTLIGMYTIRDLYILIDSPMGSRIANLLLAVLSILLLTSVYQSWQLLKLPSIEPSRKVAKPPMHQINIAKLHIFGQYQPKALDPNALPKATLGLKLIGTFIARDPRVSAALIADQSGQQQLYRGHDLLPGGAKVYKIVTESVIISQNGRLMVLDLPESRLAFGKPPAGLPILN